VHKECRSCIACHVLADDMGSSEAIIRARRPHSGSETEILHETGLAEATWLFFASGKNFPVPAILKPIVLGTGEEFYDVESYDSCSVGSSLRLARNPCLPFVLAPELHFPAQRNGIALQGCFEAGRKFARKPCS